MIQQVKPLLVTLAFCIGVLIPEPPALLLIQFLANVVRKVAEGCASAGARLTNKASLIGLWTPDMGFTQPQTSLQWCDLSPQISVSSSFWYSDFQINKLSLE